MVSVVGRKHIAQLCCIKRYITVVVNLLSNWVVSLCINVFPASLLFLAGSFCVGFILQCVVLWFPLKMQVEWRQACAGAGAREGRALTD